MFVVRAAGFLGLALTSGCALLVSFSGFAGGPDVADAASDALRDCPPDACQTITPPPDDGEGDEAGDEAGEDARLPPDEDAPNPSDASPASITRVQTVAPGWGSVQQTTLTLVAENAGDLLVAGVYFTDSTVTITVADSLGNAWAPTTAYANVTACSTGQTSVAQIFYATGVAAGMNVVTVTQSSGTSALGALVVEYSGALASGSLDGVSGGPATSSTTTMSAGSLTTTGANDLVVALFAEATVWGVITTGPGFSIVADDGTFYSMFEDDLPAGAGPGTVDPTAFESGGATSDCWVAAAAAFKAGP
jgi:hypothetical protein